MCLTCSVLLSPLHQQEYCVKPLKLHPLKPQTQFCPYWFWQPSWEMQTKKKIFVHLATFCQILLSSTEKRVFFFFSSLSKPWRVLPNFMPMMSSLALVCSPLPRQSAAAEGAAGFGKQKGVSCTCRCLPSYRISSWERCIFYTTRKSRLNKTSICLQLLSQVRRLPAAIFSSPL